MGVGDGETQRVKVLSDGLGGEQETSVLHISASVLWENTADLQLQTITA